MYKYHTFDLKNLYEVYSDVEKSIEFCQLHGLLPNKEEKKCVDCGQVVYVQRRGRNYQFFLFFEV